MDEVAAPEGAGPRGTEQGFEFGEDLLDRIQVGAMGGKKRSCAPAASIAARTLGCL